MAQHQHLTAPERGWPADVLLFAKVLQAIGFAHVGIGLWAGITRGDLWTELYMALSGLAVFGVGRWLEHRS